MKRRGFLGALLSAPIAVTALQARGELHPETVTRGPPPPPLPPQTVEDPRIEPFWRDGPLVIRHFPRCTVWGYDDYNQRVWFHCVYHTPRSDSQDRLEFTCDWPTLSQDRKVEIIKQAAQAFDHAHEKELNISYSSGIGHYHGAIR